MSETPDPWARSLLDAFEQALASARSQSEPAGEDVPASPAASEASESEATDATDETDESDATDAPDVPVPDVVDRGPFGRADRGVSRVRRGRGAQPEARRPRRGPHWHSDLPAPPAE